LSDIRVTYSGLIALVIGLISVGTGIIFTLIVTRRLSPEEFGTWSIIGSMISYFLIAEPIISFWSTRQIARGEDVGKTSLLSSASFSIGAIPLYLVFAFFVSSISHSHLDSMFLAAILLPVTFLSQTLTGINIGHKPHATSYGLLAFELLKIPAGLVLVYLFDLGINGAIITIMIAYLAKISIQVYFGKTRLRDKFNKIAVKRWLKLSWIPLYYNLSHVIWSLDVVLYSIVVGSVKGVAYYSVSVTISAIIGNAGLISQALYPKLLAKGTYDYAKANFTRLMYFSIPLLGVSVIFAKPALFALNPVYSDESIIVIIMSFRTFFYVITGVLYQMLLGIETIDVEKNPKFSSLTKSKIFFVPMLTNIQYGLYIITLVATIIILNSSGTSELQIVTWWTVISLTLQIPFFIYAWVLVKKHVKFSFPYINTLKYIAGTILFTIVFLLTSKFIINYHRSIYDFLPSLILELAVCMGVYLVTTYIIDKKTRTLFKSVLNEFGSNK
jgi:hypothetical protein